MQLPTAIVATLALALSVLSIFVSMRGNAPISPEPTAGTLDLSDPAKDQRQEDPRVRRLQQTVDGLSLAAR